MGRSRILPNGVQLKTVLALHIHPVVSELDAPINDRLGYFSLTFPHAACGMFRSSARLEFVLGSTMWHGGWGPNRCKASGIDGHTSMVLPST